jgi:hypothetical protein
MNDNRFGQLISGNVRGSGDLLSREGRRMIEGNVFHSFPIQEFLEFLDWHRSSTLLLCS